MKRLTGTSLFLLLFVLACRPALETADLVVLNGKIVTVDEENPLAAALAVKSDRILWVGTNREAEAYIGESTEVIDLDGKLAVPGFIEGHAHFLGIGRAKQILALGQARNWDEIVDMVASAVATKQPGEWILGRGWHQEKWETTPEPNIDGLPFHDALSQVSPENPVLLTHASGHAVFANAKAMEMAGITTRTPEPEGGEILKDAKGSPIGVFRETAEALFDDAMSRKNAAETSAEKETRIRELVRLASTECLSKGITSFHDAGVSFDFAQQMKAMAEAGELPLRLYLMLNESNEKLASGLPDHRWIGAGNGYLTVRAIKRFIDGALGAHGAWLLEPYTDLPESVGLNVTPLESLAETTELALKHGFQLCVHAIGDRANREILNIFEEGFQGYTVETRDFRWRIEHAQHFAETDIPRLSQLGVIASMQPIHATSDGPWVVRRLGEERAEEGAYVWRKILDSGAVLASGTDAPVEDVNPILNFQAAVSRMTLNGTTFYPDQSMTREEALKSFTLDCAYAAFEEQDKGSLVAGKLADITVLSNDILTIPVEEIPNTQVLYTIVGGKIRYAAP